MADAFDAMTFDRPYSRAISLETARDEIQRCAGTHFDPRWWRPSCLPLQTFADIRHRSLHETSAADAAAEAVRAALGNSGPTLESVVRG